MNDLDTFPHLTYEFASNTYLQDFVDAEHLVFCEKAAEPGGEYFYRWSESIPLPDFSHINMILLSAEREFVAANDFRSDAVSMLLRV